MALQAYHVLPHGYQGSCIYPIQNRYPQQQRDPLHDVVPVLYDELVLQVMVTATMVEVEVDRLPNHLCF